ncbi:MAG: AAA family ATPase [Magnetococcales bacterium]|nr:AAA family ATPase [Magnetococcales bacterium]
MKFHFKNIGLIKNASVELGDLTILAGPNNTGKTYISYTLYGFFETWIDHFSLGDEIQRIVEELKSTRHAKLDLSRVDFEKIFSDSTKQYTLRMYEIFSARREEFQRAEFLMEVESPLKVLTNNKKERSIKGNFKGAVLLIKLHFVGDAPFISFSLDDKIDNLILDDGFISHGIARIIFPSFFSDSYICVSERLGIPLFYRDLDIQKIEMVEQLQKLTDDPESRDPIVGFSKILKGIRTRYALPVRDNIDFIRSIPDFIKNDSSTGIAELNEYIISMTGGVYRHKLEEGLLFSSKPYSRANKFSLTSNLWSSSVKSLSYLFFYLKHVAESGHLLIIDEPEIHLTPKNQIILARLLAACVGKGIKVLVTTHSDYLIKEFNNLIMLHNLSENDRTDFLSQPKSPYKPSEMLNPDRVRAYVCQKGGVTPCPIDQYGISVAFMDEAIHEINETANDLMNRIDREH